MDEKLVRLPTVGSIATELGVGTHRIRYVIETRKISPTGRAGNARVFTTHDVAQIRQELARMARQREAI
ncbi:MAG TPA: hypothetical protein VK797_07365 [Tepidisphaeraceae bacterium]|jgi:DNA-binding transcriptional MerR regulator|nr:hypothetical protein [Tepidisphaeraceae bacterium]